jgi:hypothetical protein
MTEPAKDEAELIERMAEGLHNDHDLNLPEKYRGSFRTVRPPESCDIIIGSVTAVLAAIRAAGWAVVPVEPTEKMLWAADRAPAPLQGEEDPDHPQFVLFAHTRAEWAAMLAAAPGVKP